MSQPTFSDGIGYEGKVTLTLKSNNRVLKTQTYKNKGTTQLFTFLGYCLAGAYNTAQSLLPTKILLLYNDNGRYSGKEGATGSTQNATETAVSVVSAWQSRVQTPTIINDADTESVKVIYSFEVPRHTIRGRFNQVALYGAGAADADITKFSAYYYLVDDDKNFDDQDPSSWSPSTVLLIEWELNISNKNSETVNNNGGE